MRFLLVFLVVLVLAWRWRAWRETLQRKMPPTKEAGSGTTTMVACHQCGVHVPVQDAIIGKHGHYCSTAHRLSMEP